MLTQNVLRNRTAEVTESERAILEQAISHTRSYAAGQTVVRQDATVGASTLLVEGLMTRHVDASDGRRHLVSIHVPGDFVDLHAYALRQLDHAVGALTDCVVAVFPHEALRRIERQHPRLTRRLWFSTLLDAATHRQWVVRLANLNALQRVANFLCEMNARLLAIDRSDGLRFELAMTQADIGDVCGLTNVHVNRVVRQLRERELCSIRSAQVHILDPQGLTHAGQFKPDYLYLNPPMASRAVGCGES